MATDIYYALCDMSNTQDYPTVEEIREMLTTETGRAYLLHSLIDIAFTGDEECMSLVYRLIDKMERGDDYVDTL